MEEVPTRGRIIIVNFEKAGTAVPPEMVGTKRPCLVIQNNNLSRGGLVTLVPLSSTKPNVLGKQHHEMSHLSFLGLPLEWDRTLTRWAKCDYLITVSLDRCSDPYSKPAYGGRKYVKVKAAKCDVDAVDRCVLWGLGIVGAA